MKKHFTLFFVMLFSVTALLARPVNEAGAKAVAQRFLSLKISKELRDNDLQLAHTGVSTRGETCFYVFNAGGDGFVIVSADDRFRPIVGYSDEGPFATENPSPEAMFYLDRIIEARTSRSAVLFDNTAEEWQSVMTSGKLLSRNGGRGVDYICTTKWNQDSPYNLYAPEANGGPGGRCYAGCVATAMSQVMKRWDHPLQGTGSHSYYCYGYGMQSANFGNTTYDWDNMPDRLSGASQEEIEAVATLMYHCAVAVDMDFSPSGSGANSWDVPGAIRQYFSYSNHASLKGRDEYSLTNWQNMLKEQFDLGWPVYYSGFSSSGGHAFVCDGYDDDDLFHFNWGWGGSSDGWFVVDEIDYAGWAQAIFNYVPGDVYDYMPMQPENLSVTSSGDFDYTATIQWTNPTQNIHFNNLSSIDQIKVTRNGETIHTFSNATPGANMSYTDHYLPALATYSVYAIVHGAKGIPATEEDILLGPTCNWTVEMSASDAQGWHGGSLVFVNEANDIVAQTALESAHATRTVVLPLGHVGIVWDKPAETVESMSFEVKCPTGNTWVSYEGASTDLGKGLFFIINNTCSEKDGETDGPTNLTVHNASNHAALSWDAPEDLDVINYHVYRDDVLYAVTSNRTFTDSQYLNDYHHYYVTAFTELGETTASNTGNVAPASTCAIPTNLHFEMTTPTKAKIMWDAPDDPSVTGYFVYRRVKGEEFKRVKALTNTYYTDNLTSRPDDQYEYAVSAYYQADDCLSGYATAQDNPELNFIEVNKTIIPQHLSFFIHEGHVVLQWDEATMAESYNIYRDGELIGHSNDNNFVDYNANSQFTYHYTVTGKTGFIESNPTNEVYVDWTTGMGEDTDNQGLAIYPNPTENILTIEGQEIRHVHVFNMMGQSILNQNVDEDRITIDLSEQPAGCYFIEVMSEQGIKTNKVLKIK